MDYWDGVQFSSHHFKGTYYQHGITVEEDLEHLAEVMFGRFLCEKVTHLPPSPSYTLCREVTIHSLPIVRIYSSIL